MLKFLIVGLGSMGKRRIRNLRCLKEGSVIGYDPCKDRREDAQQKYEIPVYSEFEEAMATDPDALVICTPPDRHTQYARIALGGRKHFFTEASVVDDGMDEVIHLAARTPVVAAPSCTMRFHPSIARIKALVEENVIGPILCFTYHCGQYLPDWHPWEDYRSFYVAKRETGGCREIVPFELAWLTWILGQPEMISCLKGKLSGLEADIDDVYQILIRFQRSTLGHLLVDIISRVPYRTCRLISESGVIEWNWADKCVRVFLSEGKRWMDYPEPRDGDDVGPFGNEHMYVEEMRCFVEAIRGKRVYPYTLAEDKKILDLLYAAERSSDESIHVRR